MRSRHPHSSALEQSADLENSARTKSEEKNSKIVQIKKVPLQLAEKACFLIMIKNITELVKYQ
jgi:hypothetical protein